MPAFNTKDHYFHKAKAAGYKARSVFKLEEIDRALKLIKADSVVLDLGCAPGSWLQYLALKLGSKGQALGIDLSKITESFGPNIHVVQDDVFLLNKEKIVNYLPTFNGFDLVLSDMAPKTTGIKHVDQLRSFALAEQAYGLALDLLKSGGHVVIKIFNSAEVSKLIGDMKKSFKTVKHMRPQSIRTISKEFYIVGLNKK